MFFGLPDNMIMLQVLEAMLDDDQDMQDMYLARRAEMAQLIAPGPPSPRSPPPTGPLALLPTMSATSTAEKALALALQTVAADQDVMSPGGTAATVSQPLHGNLQPKASASGRVLPEMAKDKPPGDQQQPAGTAESSALSVLQRPAGSQHGRADTDHASTTEHQQQAGELGIHQRGTSEGTEQASTSEQQQQPWAHPHHLHNLFQHLHRHPHNQQLQQQPQQQQQQPQQQQQQQQQDQSSRQAELLIHSQWVRPSQQTENGQEPRPSLIEDQLTNHPLSMSATDQVRGSSTQKLLCNTLRAQLVYIWHLTAARCSRIRSSH